MSEKRPEPMLDADGNPVTVLGCPVYLTNDLPDFQDGVVVVMRTDENWSVMSEECQLCQGERHEPGDEMYDNDTCAHSAERVCRECLEQLRMED